MSSQLEIFLKALSRLLGWIYTLCWSASFYPQPISNFRRRSTVGLAIDFPTINALGYVCYTGYTAAFLYSPVIRHQYAARHPGSEGSTVRFNDFAFAVHAIILRLFWGSIVAIAILIFIVLGQSPDGGYDPSTWGWIDVVYGLSYVKLLVTITKYVPQAWVNYKRKSTQGWHIGQILLDLVGGVLSLIQLFLDSSFEEDWSGITGNPIKFLLSNVSILFDFLFMVQHYILYRGADEKVTKHQDPDVTTPLLTESNGAWRTEDV
ncbi:PQ loop repeat-domain-containing protein [Aspergillus transmontanensis]|uniref:PQ loop repeat-domain-containing protein n=1 Tax=Aspergillus transmontanensis TaxID=1034304 RepID=A0A5N6VF86_9EURO|nr:PQ loop repeat-domain-containing protein [Aspergillus transmontanensis]